MFQLREGYYRGPVYEWNLPSGWTCPGADGCLVRVDRHTSLANNLSTEFRCYAASAERFPGVRASRWGSLESYVKKQRITRLPLAARHVRVHSSGDFYSQAYFDGWIAYCLKHIWVRFWAYTKSIPFWLARINSIPKNLVLTASLGGKFDDMAIKAGLRTATVIDHRDPRAVAGPVDTNDDLAREDGPSFFLLDNNARG